MKKHHNSKLGFLRLRLLASFTLCSTGVLLATSSFTGIPWRLAGCADGSNCEQEREHAGIARLERDMPVPGGDPDDLIRMEQIWMDRLSYPTGRFDPKWIRRAAEQDARIRRAVPFGAGRTNLRKGLNAAQALDPNNFTALGPQPEHMTGCTGCFDYGVTEGRVNTIAIDPTTTTNGSIIAYIGSDGGGVWKTTNCCNGATSWTKLTDDALISTTAIDTLAIDPNDHNTIYAGTGDLNFGSFSQGSQGILKSTDGGASWTILGANIFGAALPQPAGQFPQYQSVGKVRVDPNNTSNVVAGTKTGLYFSYDGGTNWTGPCTTNSFNTQRQDITGLELTNISGTTRILAAVGVRGFATPVQYNLDQNGANGLYTANMAASGCPSFTSIAGNGNGFVYGPGIAAANSAGNGGAGYTTAQAMNASSGTPYGGVGVGDQLGRIDIAVAPSDPNTIYAQVQSIAANINSTGSGGGGCANAPGCQLGLWSSTDGGANWTFMSGSAGATLKQCASSGNANSTSATAWGDYPQNWYDQGIAVDPNDPTKLFIDTHEIWWATQSGTVWYNTTCTYNQSSAIGMHADEHALAFVPGSSSILIAGNDGGIHATTNANATVLNTTRPTWFDMNNGVNTIEFYSGDIGANFATDSNPVAVGGAQDNGPSSVTFAGTPTGPVQWQMGLGGDGFSGQVSSIAGTTPAKGTIALTTGGAVAGETFMIGTQTFTFQAGARSGTGQVQLASSTTTEGNNIVAAINADISSQVTAARSGATVVVTATVPGPSGNSIPFNESATNMTMDGSGSLGGTQQGGLTTSTQPVFYQGNNSGGLSRCITNCTQPSAAWTNIKGGWGSDQQSFVLPVNLFHGGMSGGDDCLNGCGHMLAGTTRVWETVTANNAAFWYITDNPSGLAGGPNLCKGTLGNRSFINQVKYSPKFQSVAIVGTNDGNVQIGFNLGTGAANQANWVDVTGGNMVLPNRPILGIALDPSVATADVPVAYATVGGFNFNTPTTLGHLFQVTCASNCTSFVWADKTGNLPDIPVDSVIVNPNFPQQVYAGTDFGLYYTDDITVASPVWNRFQNGLPNAMIWDMAIDRGSTTLSVWTRSRGAFVWPLPSGAVPIPVPTSIVSRKTHGGAGPFDVDLKSPAPGIECRTGGATGDHTLVVTFAGNTVVSGNGTAKAQVTSGTGDVGSNGVPNGNAVTVSGNEVTIPLTNVVNAQSLSITIYGVNDSTNVGNVIIPMKVLLGDTTATGDVNSSDVTEVKSQSGATVDGTNFRDDLNISGSINSSDVSVVKVQSGTSIPATPAKKRVELRR